MSQTVLALYQTYVPGLRKSGGANHTGFCPLHGEVEGRSTPSFSVNEDTGQWHCFAGCGGGGISSFLKAVGKGDGYIKQTIERVKPFLREPRKPNLFRKKEARLFETAQPLSEQLLGLFQRAPVLLLTEGFSEEVMAAEYVGVDEGHGCITFPIRDLYGNLAGIVGKSLDGSKFRSKYNAYTAKEMREYGVSQGYQFDKSHYFWGWERLYDSHVLGRSTDPIYVVEGFKARLWCIQNGFPNTIALMTSSASDVQNLFLERLRCPVIVALDNDKAGRAGTGKLLERQRGNPLIRVADWPIDDVQPDDLTRSELHDSFTRALKPLHWRRKHEWRTSAQYAARARAQE